jgi:hypothetical protein
MAKYSNRDLEDFFDAYVEAALAFTNDESTEQGGEPLDRNYGPDDLAQSAEDELVVLAKKFLDKAWPLLEQAPSRINGYPYLEMAGHDFWLTHNEYGAGFGDGDWPDEIDDRLHDLAQKFPTVNLYVGDDGKIYT